LLLAPTLEGEPANRDEIGSRRPCDDEPPAHERRPVTSSITEATL
jgi:hypothetical protein